MSSIELREITKHFGNFAIIKELNLSIAEGEFVAFVGPSGCGKSTLLRMISGLERVSAGEIYFSGKRVDELTPKDRNIALVFQSYALYPHMTVEQNLGFNLRLAGKPRDEIRRRTRDVACMLDIEPLMQRRPGQLSGGQKQRVAMGRALVREPSVFLFDEPLSNLDAQLRIQMRSEIKALHQNLRITSIYVTHDQIEAMTLADRIVVMNQGRIEQEDSPSAVYSKPANLFVAAFIGSPPMNLIDGHLSLSGAIPMVRLNTGLSLHLSVSPDLTDGTAVVVGIRPEDISLDFGEDRVAGIVKMVEPTGSSNYITLDVGGSRLTVVVGRTMKPSLGSELLISIKPETLHLFEKSTGLRVSR